MGDQEPAGQVLGVGFIGCLPFCPRCVHGGALKRGSSCLHRRAVLFTFVTGTSIGRPHQTLSFPLVLARAAVYLGGLLFYSLVLAMSYGEVLQSECQYVFRLDLR